MKHEYNRKLVGLWDLQTRWVEPRVGNKHFSVHHKSRHVSEFMTTGWRDVTDDVDGGAGRSCAAPMIRLTGELPSEAQIHAAAVNVQPGALAVRPVPGLSVARDAARPQRPGLSVGTFEPPAQLQGQRRKTCRLALDWQDLSGNSRWQRGGVEGEGRRFWTRAGQ